MNIARHSNNFFCLCINITAKVLLKMGDYKNTTKHISMLIHQYRHGDEVADHDIRELLGFHPSCPIESHELQWLKMKLSKPFNTLCLTYKLKNSGMEETIS